MVRLSPMNMANAAGPARSPMVLETPRPDSANVLAHWLMPCSEAPAHSIMMKNTVNSGLRTSSPSFIEAVPSGRMSGIGEVANSTIPTIGTMAHRQAITGQASRLASAKNSVEIATVPTCPQQ